MKIKKGRRSPQEAQRPQMTSLVDILTVLVVFLIQSFSAEGEIITMSPNLVLPNSTAQQIPEKTLTVSISLQHILVDDEPIALVEEEVRRRDMMVPALGRMLEKKRLQSEEQAKFNDAVKFKGKITILGDRKIPYWLLQKVLFTCGDKGYLDFSLAVLKAQ